MGAAMLYISNATRKANVNLTNVIYSSWNPEPKKYLLHITILHPGVCPGGGGPKGPAPLPKN